MIVSRRGFLYVAASGAVGTALRVGHAPATAVVAPMSSFARLRGIEAAALDSVGIFTLHRGDVQQPILQIPLSPGRHFSWHCGELSAIVFSERYPLHFSLDGSMRLLQAYFEFGGYSFVYIEDGTAVPCEANCPVVPPRLLMVSA